MKKGNKHIKIFILKAVFRIRIRLDPYHLAGSGSTSGNVDMDPGIKKKNDIKINYFKNKISL